MFSRLFIDLLNMYNKIATYTAVLLANNTSFNYSINKTTININTIDDYLIMINIYRDFISYYEVWYLSYYNKKYI